MSNMELEMKILNINEKELSKKIEKLGGKYISTSKQYLYVYDLMYINQRYHSYLYELSNETLKLRKNIDLEKIKNLFIDNYKMTPKKWIRLRKTVEENANGNQKETTTLTIKHILKNDNSGIQQMKETEILVNSLEETNELLENLGFSYRSYQEKKRIKYILNEHEIDIDTWPKLPTYFDVEGKNKKDLENLLNLLGYSFEEAVSCTVDEIYQTIGMDINNMKELRF